MTAARSTPSRRRSATRSATRGPASRRSGALAAIAISNSAATRSRRGVTPGVTHRPAAAAGGTTQSARSPDHHSSPQRTGKTRDTETRDGEEKPSSSWITPYRGRWTGTSCRGYPPRPPGDADGQPSQQGHLDAARALRQRGSGAGTAATRADAPGRRQDRSADVVGARMGACCAAPTAAPALERASCRGAHATRVVRSTAGTAPPIGPECREGDHAVRPLVPAKGTPAPPRSGW